MISSGASSWRSIRKERCSARVTVWTQFKKSREPGSMIGLSSTAAIKGYTAHHAYAAMKGAVIGHHTGDFRDARLFGNQIDLGLIRK